MSAVAIPDKGDNAFGLVCRGQDNGDGYLFRISSDGYYSITIDQGDNFKTLVDWTESDLIHKSSDNNTLQASCVGSHLKMWINSKLAGETDDSTFTTGDIGVTVTTYEDKPTEVHFDDFMARKP
jgi:hypothetical protein